MDENAFVGLTNETTQIPTLTTTRTLDEKIEGAALAEVNKVATEIVDAVEQAEYHPRQTLDAAEYARYIDAQNKVQSNFGQ